ncbi:MAG: hypothetical protein DMF51_00430 [Acidobacteria bacterium]|nr:MAG: hypothetical protein DMF51_00430 [Acidobacteriota bacterium]
MKSLLLCLAAAGLATGPALGAETARPAPPPKISALRCGRLLDVRTGALKEGALVIVQGDRIDRVLDAGAKPPEGAALYTSPRRNTMSSS